jgi:hypothetical protein
MSFVQPMASSPLCQPVQLGSPQVPPVYSAKGCVLCEEAHRAKEAQAGADEAAYRAVKARISERYKDFSQPNETGIDKYGQPSVGLTADISDVTNAEVVCILRHICAEPELLVAVLKKSAISPLFDKIYLMEDKEAGWNLRLHLFSPGADQGSEELPHYHRWTLASKILLGGYNNKNYEKILYEDADESEKYFEYRLDPSASGEVRTFHASGKVGMRLIQQTLFRSGDVRHFPIALPHSVSDMSRHTGTTMTLAHTGRPDKDQSVAFEKADTLTSKDLEHLTDGDFKNAVAEKIVLLQLMDLNAHFMAHLLMLNDKGDGRTPEEEAHFIDRDAANYLETAFMPTMEVLQKLDETATKSPADNGGLSVEMAELLRNGLQDIDKDALERLFVKNYKQAWPNHDENYMSPENASNRPSTQFSNWGEIKHSMVEAGLRADGAGQSSSARASSVQGEHLDAAMPKMGSPDADDQSGHSQ